jgi:hypothetical protein
VSAPPIRDDPLSLRARTPPTLVVIAMVWGVVVIALGMAQTRLVLGPSHWIVQVAHLLVGVIAMGLGGGIQAHMRRVARAAPAAPSFPTAARH